MRNIVIALSFISVMLLGFWAYTENYRTQERLKEVASLQREIGLRRERLSILKAELAYLSRPERLRDLSVTNFERLGHVEMSAHHFGRVSQVEYPEVNLEGKIIRPVSVSGDLPDANTSEGQN
ncbi:MAG: cell division protein FtsL [Halocynthiibacter sp.]